MEIKTTNKKYSFRGYKFSIWLKRNKETLKTLITACVGLGVFFIPTITDPGMSAAAAVISATITKLLVDAFDFWLSEVEVSIPVDGNLIK